MTPTQSENPKPQVAALRTDSLAQSGEYTAARGEMDVFTREFSHPTGTYPSQPVRITFRGGTIDSVVSLRPAGVSLPSPFPRSRFGP